MRPMYLLCCLTALAAAPLSQALAADAHTGIQPDPGEMVLLRDVNARHAYRPAPPSIALIVDPTPNREIDQSLGTGELSDEDFAALSSNQPGYAAQQGPMPQQVTQRALQGSLGRAMGENGALSGTGMTRTIGGATGAVTGATRGIAPTVTGALSQFPLGGATAGKGP